jgi:hypothetical protein
MRDPKAIWDGARRGPDDDVPALRSEVEKGRLRAEFQALQISLQILEEHKADFQALRAALERVGSYTFDFDALRSSAELLRSEVAALGRAVESLHQEVARLREGAVDQSHLEAIGFKIDALAAARVVKSIEYDGDGRIAKVVEKREVKS